MSGQVVHFEVPADDLDRARNFYSEAFGWNLSPVPDLDYTMVGTAATDEQGRPAEPGAINGGMMRRQDPLTAPVITIAVEDINKALETVQSLGGSTVLPKQPVMGMGFSAYFKDTEGNIMGLWENAM